MVLWRDKLTSRAVKGTILTRCAAIGPNGERGLGYKGGSLVNDHWLGDMFALMTKMLRCSRLTGVESVCIVVEICYCGGRVARLRTGLARVQADAPEPEPEPDSTPSRHGYEPRDPC